MPEDAIVRRTMDRLLLDEANHRVANEVAAALAAMRVAQSSRYKGCRSRLIDVAIDRLEGFGKCARLFASLPSGLIDVGSLVSEVSSTMLRSRLDGGRTRLTIDVESVTVEAELGRIVAMIAYELINNALKHAFNGRDGCLKVGLEAVASGIVLSVTDDGPGLEAANSYDSEEHRLGGRLVSDLVRLSKGHLACTTGPSGTSVRVMVPTVVRL